MKNLKFQNFKIFKYCVSERQVWLKCYWYDTKHLFKISVSIYYVILGNVERFEKFDLFDDILTYPGSSNIANINRFEPRQFKNAQHYQISKHELQSHFIFSVWRVIIENVRSKTQSCGDLDFRFCVLDGSRNFKDF